MSKPGHRFAIGILVLSAACGGNKLSEEETAEAFGAVSIALTGVEAAADASASGGSVSATATCSGGGSISVQGDWTGSESFSIDLTFNDCSEAGVTIDGTLRYSATSVSTDSFTMNMDGTLSFSGGVEGDCDIDVSISATSTSATFSGSMCGQDINDLTTQ